MIPEGEAQELIDRLERHSRRSRPFLIYGLVAILAGFLVLTFYINGLRADAEERRAAAETRARDLEVKKAELRQRIDQAGRLAAGDHSPAEAPQVLSKIRAILAEASETTETLAATVEEPAPTLAAEAHQPDAVATVAPSPAPAKAKSETKVEPAQGVTQEQRPKVIRIFLHVGDKEQFSGARELQWSLGGASLDGTRIVVQGIEVVEGGGDDSLRCLKRQDCARAGEVAAIVNAELRGRSLRVRDLSRTYERARNVRPGTYEVWLAPGKIYITGE